MKIKVITIIGLSLLTSISYGATSKYISGSITDDIYYRIGGGSVSTRNFLYQKPNSIGVGIKWQSNLICGNFDFRSTISNQLNGVTEGFNDVMGSIVNNATAAVASLPALIIQRANPQLYDLLTNGVLQAKLDYSDMKMSCRQMANKMADYAEDAGLVQAAKIENLASLLGGQVDAVRADKIVEHEGGDNGISWIGGVKKGGKGQPPINLTKDVTMAGYNLLLNRNVTDTSPVSDADTKGSIYKRWNRPSDAQDWITDVLGDLTYTSTTSNNKKSKPGRGLNPVIQDYYEEYYSELVDLINGKKAINDENLKKVNGGGIQITRGLIESLQNDSERAVLTNRLSSEIALSRTIEETLMARRILLAGLKEPNIAYNTTLKDIMNTQIAELDIELNQIRLEFEMKKMISGNTALVIAERNKNRQKGLTIPLGQSDDAIYKNN